MFRLLNADRAAKDLPALEYDERLADVARAHSADMRDHDFFRHESKRTGSLKDRLTAARVPVVAARENLADAHDVPTAQQGLLKSRGHYANIMAKDVTHVGVGITRGGKKHPRNLLFTQVFARPYEVEPASTARERVLQAVRAARDRKNLPSLETSGRLDALAADAAAGISTPPTNRSIKKVSQSIFNRLQDAPIKGIQGLALSASYIAQTPDFQVPPELLTAGVTAYGLAIRPIQDKARPMLLVVLLSGV